VVDARTEHRTVTFEGGHLETPVYDRAVLPIGSRVDGPAVVEDAGSTTVILPGQSASVDEYGNIVVEVDP